MKWIDLKLSDEFNNCLYYSTTYKKFITELNNKHFELGFYQYNDIISDNETTWNIPNNCKLEFIVNVLDSEIKSLMIGWDTYIINADSKLKRKRFRTVLNVKVLDKKLQFQIIAYYKKKISTNKIEECRALLSQELLKNIENKSHYQVNKLFLSGLLNKTLTENLRVMNDSIREVEIYKSKVM